MRGYLRNNYLGFISKASILLVVVASAAGLYVLARDQLRPRVTELTGRIEARYHSGPMAFSPDGKTLALPKRADGRVELWSFETGKVQVLMSSLNKDKAPADHIAFSNGGRFLAVYFRARGVTVWDLLAKKEQAHIPVSEPSYVSDMAFSNDNGTLVAVMGTFKESDIEADSDKFSSVRWDVSTGRKQEVHVFHPFIRVMALSPDGRYAVLKQNEGQTVFDLATGKRIFAIVSDGRFLFSDDDSMLVSYNGHQVTLWDVPSGNEFRHFAFVPGFLPNGYGYCLSLSPDKKVLAVGGFTESYIVGLIDLESGKVLDKFQCCPTLMLCRAVRFSPDGRTLATDTEAVDKYDRDRQPLLKFWKIPTSW